jgi:WD40 repeat protein
MQVENPSYHLYQTLIPHTAGVRALATGGPYLITGSIDKTCKIYKRKDGKYDLINEVEIFEDYILSLHVTKNHQNFVVGCKNNLVYILDLEGNPHLVLEGHNGPVNSISESGSGKLITGAWDGTAIVWDPSTGQALWKLEGHAYAVSVLGLENDIFITGSQDKNIHIFDG